MASYCYMSKLATVLMVFMWTEFLW